VSVVDTGRLYGGQQVKPADEQRQPKEFPAPTAGMATAIDLVGLLVVLGVNSAAAAVLTRFFRVRLDTRWGSVVYALTLVPLVLLVLTLVLGSVLGPDLGSPAAVVGVTVLVPLAVGISFDYFWMPAPEEVDLPERYEA
jgi:hypothetical protein